MSFINLILFIIFKYLDYFKYFHSFHVQSGCELASCLCQINITHILEYFLTLHFCLHPLWSQNKKCNTHFCRALILSPKKLDQDSHNIYRNLKLHHIKNDSVRICKYHCEMMIYCQSNKS